MKKLLKFEEAAMNHYIDISNEIEINMRPGGLYDNATDHASKLMENIARVAGIIHVINDENDENDEISYETLDTAIHTCIFFSQEYMRVFDSKPQHVLNAMILNHWLTSKVRSQNDRYIPKRHVRQYCSSELRKPTQFRDALEYLECIGAIRVFVDPTNKHLIDTLPHLA